ncbi:MAG TPA: class I SAM-dependent methyltransferase [Micromonosporaceae bacterium]
MEGYTAQTYGDLFADLYDEMVADSMVAGNASAAADFLAALAPRGRALELGIGTGRVALPLAARGVEVHGIDASEKMVARLRDKPGGADLRVDVGDFADVDAPGSFDLVYVVFNTLFALPSQDEQVRCLANAAARLRPGGRFVVEAFVPDVTRYDRGQRVQAVRVDAGQVRLDVSRHDPLNQTITVQNVLIGADGIRLLPVFLRYAWPAELDVMARLAGLRLVDRFSGWHREPFTAASGAHISVYARTAEGSTPANR